MFNDSLLVSVRLSMPSHLNKKEKPPPYIPSPAGGYRRLPTACLPFSFLWGRICFEATISGSRSAICGEEYGSLTTTFGMYTGQLGNFRFVGKGCLELFFLMQGEDGVTWVVIICSLAHCVFVILLIRVSVTLSETMWLNCYFYSSAAPFVVIPQCARNPQQYSRTVDGLLLLLSNLSCVGRCPPSHPVSLPVLWEKTSLL